MAANNKTRVLSFDLDDTQKTIQINKVRTGDKDSTELKEMLWAVLMPIRQDAIDFARGLLIRNNKFDDLTVLSTDLVGNVVEELMLPENPKGEYPNRYAFLGDFVIRLRWRVTDLLKGQIKHLKLDENMVQECADGFPYRKVESAEETMLIQLAFNRYSETEPNKANAVYMKYYLKIPRKHIAKILGVSLRTVQSWIPNKEAGANSSPIFRELRAIMKTLSYDY